MVRGAGAGVPGPAPGWACKRFWLRDFAYGRLWALLLGLWALLLGVWALGVWAVVGGRSSFCAFAGAHMRPHAPTCAHMRPHALASARFVPLVPVFSRSFPFFPVFSRFFPLDPVFLSFPTINQKCPAPTCLAAPLWAHLL